MKQRAIKENFKTTKLPLKIKKILKPFFWDVDFAKMDLVIHKDFIIGRILAHGNWDSVCWLRKHYGDKALRNWMLVAQGRELDMRRLRHWQFELSLPSKTVDTWIKRISDSTWGKRFVASQKINISLVT